RITAARLAARRLVGGRLTGTVRVATAVQAAGAALAAAARLSVPARLAGATGLAPPARFGPGAAGPRLAAAGRGRILAGDRQRPLGTQVPGHVVVRRHRLAALVQLPDGLRRGLARRPGGDHAPGAVVPPVRVPGDLLA